ncbi:hypothetical protein LUZ60_005526 [Juncus effusus]|nr:hypothetical protein LUZ60_005526 [Juncus effusus]
MNSNPPLMDTYKHLFANNPQPFDPNQTARVEECNLPLVDLNRLISKNSETISACKRDIITAASEWGFFQVVNHGIPYDLLLELRELQKKIFQEPHEKKRSEKLYKLSPDSYCWGTPSATKLEQLSWSEAYHIPLNSIDTMNRNIIGEISTALSKLAHDLASILSTHLGDKNGDYVKESCTRDTCYLRLNHYPICEEPSGAFGLAPHTDSDFLTILYQDQVGGLQLWKHDTWFTVRPNPHALIINIGDLFQAWSNDMYKSVKHRVLVNSRVERFSVAYFLCPSYETVIKGYSDPSVYKRFTFGEYRQQIKDDVRLMGRKIGLSRFLA